MVKVIEADIVKRFLFDKFKIPFDADVDALPSASVQTNTQARWKRKVVYQPRWKGKVETQVYFVCSNCLSAYDRELNRCPVCDAWMKGGKEK